MCVSSAVGTSVNMSVSLGTWFASTQAKARHPRLQAQEGQHSPAQTVGLLHAAELLDGHVRDVWVGADLDLALTAGKHGCQQQQGVRAHALIDTHENFKF